MVKINFFFILFLCSNFFIFSNNINDDLISSVQKGNFDKVKICLAAGADFRYKDKDGESAVTTAMKLKNIKMLELFAGLINGNPTRSDNSDNFRYVNADVGLRLRESPDANGKIIVVIPNKETLKFLDDKGNDIEISGTRGKWTIVEWNGKIGWVFGGFLQTFDDIMIERAHSEMNDNAVKIFSENLIEEFRDAIINNEIDKLKNVFTKGLNPNALIEIKGGKVTLLVYILMFGKYDQLKEILKQNVDVNYFDFNSDPWSPLTFVSVNRMKDYFIELIAHGANVNLQNSEGNTSLMYTIRYYNENDLEMINLLIKNNADLNIRNDLGYTALMIASAKLYKDDWMYSESLEIVKLLLKNKADPNIVDENGESALIHSVKDDNIEIVKELIKNNTDVNIKNNDGKSALTFGKELKNKEMFDILRKSGAKE